MNVAVFDIDNTLAYDPNNPEENAFKLTDDYIINGLLPTKSVIKKLESYLKKDWYVIVLTGRPEPFMEATQIWLDKHLSDYMELIMRPKDLGFEKINIYKTRHAIIISQKFKEVHFYDDDPDTLMMIGNVIPKAKLFRVCVGNIEHFDYWERPLYENQS